MPQFQTIDKVENESPNTVIDVVGVVESVQDNVTIQKKDGTETTKRSLLLRDQSGRSVELSMWGAYSEDPGNLLEEVPLSFGTPLHEHDVGWVRDHAMDLELGGHVHAGRHNALAQRPAGARASLALCLT